jgi:hypothetical protein
MPGSARRAHARLPRGPVGNGGKIVGVFLSVVVALAGLALAAGAAYLTYRLVRDTRP